MNNRNNFVKNAVAFIENKLEINFDLKAIDFQNLETKVYQYGELLNNASGEIFVLEPNSFYLDVFPDRKNNIFDGITAAIYIDGANYGEVWSYSIKLNDLCDYLHIAPPFTAASPFKTY